MNESLVKLNKYKVAIICIHWPSKTFLYLIMHLFVRKWFKKHTSVEKKCIVNEQTNVGFN